MTAYYNEFDPKAAAWLRELIAAGLIADGEVDERSITDVDASDLAGFTQCHFFAGIGGWSYALRLAGWPDDRPVWTGSAPCQPFSAAGAGLAADDARHLAPTFLNLVRAARPRVLFGEQVASAAVLGRVPGKAKQPAAPEWAWIDDLSDRLEAAHYAVGACDIPAAGIGAPHIRQRTWFRAERLGHPAGIGRAEPGERGVERGCGAVGVADADNAGPQGWGKRRDRADQRAAGPDSLDGWLADADERQRGRVAIDGEHVSDGSTGERNEGNRQPERDRADRGLANASTVGHDGRRAGEAGNEPGSIERSERLRDAGSRPSAPDEFWRTADWLFCRDGKWRPVESGTFALAPRVPGRVGLLRGYGNAIVPQVAAEFIRLTEEALT